jgi:hypothetical protein
MSFTILSITAALMLAGHLMLPQSARGSEAVKDRDYQLVTARVQQGGEGLYILDNRTGQIAVFTYDPASKSLRARAVRMVSDAFNIR